MRGLNGLNTASSSSSDERALLSWRAGVLFCLLSYREKGTSFWLVTGAERMLDLSWKVRYRTLFGFFSHMIKLYRARSLLFRRQILQENIRWKALEEIYKIYMLLHRSDLNISENVRQTFSHFSANVCRSNLWFSKICHWILLRIWWNFVGISQRFSKMLKNDSKILNFLNF